MIRMSAILSWRNDQIWAFFHQEPSALPYCGKAVHYDVIDEISLVYSYVFCRDTVYSHPGKKSSISKKASTSISRKMCWIIAQVFSPPACGMYDERCLLKLWELTRRGENALLFDKIVYTHTSTKSSNVWQQKHRHLQLPIHEIFTLTSSQTCE